MSKLILRNILTSGIGLIVAWVFISRVIVPWIYQPRDIAKHKVKDLELKVAKLKESEEVTENDEYYLTATSRKTFSMDESEAISRMGSHLTEAIKASGLSEDRFTRRPLKTIQLTKNGAKQIGYTVSGQGPLPKIIDLLFLLEQSPSLPRNTVKSYTQQGTKLTLETEKPHPFQKGQMVQIRGAFPVNREFPSSYNGVFRVINTDTNPSPMSLTLTLPSAGKKKPTATNSLAFNSNTGAEDLERNWLSRLIFGGESKKEKESGPEGNARIKGTKQIGNRITITTRGNHPFKTGNEIRLYNLTPSLLNKTVKITTDSSTKLSFVLDDGEDAHTAATISGVVPRRVENITMLPVDTSTEARIDFQFLSLVVGPTKLAREKQVKTRGVRSETLQSEERPLFAAISKRAFFLPYQKKPPPAPPPPTPPKPTSPSVPPPPGPETYKIVSLSQWQGQPEIMVLDSNQNKTVNYKPGDDLAGGKIVMIDYRKMPFPKKPALLSQSRVILAIEEEYWAIERGNTLADKHKLAPEQLPANLAKR